LGSSSTNGQACCSPAYNAYIEVIVFHYFLLDDVRKSLVFLQVFSTHLK
jgi:hypothetical protein